MAALLLLVLLAVPATADRIRSAEAEAELSLAKEKYFHPTCEVCCSVDGADELSANAGLLDSPFYDEGNICVKNGDTLHQSQLDACSQWFMEGRPSADQFEPPSPLNEPGQPHVFNNDACKQFCVQNAGLCMDLRRFPKKPFKLAPKNREPKMPGGGAAKKAGGEAGKKKAGAGAEAGGEAGGEAGKAGGEAAKKAGGEAAKFASARSSRLASRRAPLPDDDDREDSREDDKESDDQWSLLQEEVRPRVPRMRHQGKAGQALSPREVLHNVLNSASRTAIDANSVWRKMFPASGSKEASRKAD